jgi:hypothetical protein
MRFNHIILLLIFMVLAGAFKRPYVKRIWRVSRRGKGKKAESGQKGEASIDYVIMPYFKHIYYQYLS